MFQSCPDAAIRDEGRKSMPPGERPRFTKVSCHGRITSSLFGAALYPRPLSPLSFQSWIRMNDDAYQWGAMGLVWGDTRTFGTVYIGARGIIWGTSSN
jgi:hypothetical protein